MTSFSVFSNPLLGLDESSYRFVHVVHSNFHAEWVSAPFVPFAVAPVSGPIKMSGALDQFDGVTQGRSAVVSRNRQGSSGSNVARRR